MPDEQAPFEDGRLMLDRFQSEPSTLAERMLIIDKSLLGDASAKIDKPESPRNLGPNSLAMTGGSHTLLSSLASNNVPSLGSDQWSHPSSPTDTDSTRTVDMPVINEYMLQEENGVFVIPAAATKLECPFHFLLCRFTFTLFADWFSHSLSHFYGEGPPNAAICCFCDDTFYNQTDAVRCWEDRMRHVAEHHKRGQTLESAKPDFHLCEYLKDIRVISEEQLRSMKMEPQPFDNTPQEESSNSIAQGFGVRESREERRHRRRR
ncbi:MAG: hypothetical protein M4579_001766 [Chaenotheca gracillima]|nr:MAG: hypothetical protein M4579_001766 [Chaenotheca gracillima]